ncbi:hypothetical protein KJ632_04730 [Patescibacteria group bacterium]|nr:hypothetical protein [Patescibacteria group bacterium]
MITLDTANLKIAENKRKFYIPDFFELKKIPQIRTNFTHFVLLGIGGSALSAKLFNSALAQNENFHILDNIDPTQIKEIEAKINIRQTLFIVISKSGQTVETQALYKYFSSKAPENQFLFITSEKENHLHKHENKYTFPNDVPGRFSALTEVGLIPALLMGLNPKRIIAGAQKILQNPKAAIALAQAQHQQYLKGKDIHALMPYSYQLRDLPEFFAQLIAESLGKKGKGITPLKAMGATDQHSQIQLYNDGPKDKLIIFVEIEKIHHSIHEFAKLLKIEKKATEMALAKNRVPTITIKLDQLNEETLGELIMLLYLSTAFLGELMKINPFDQPGVELGKQLIKKLLP